MDERDVRHDRHLPAERVVDLGLARGIGEVVVAADDVGDAHVVVVDHDGEHVGRRAVGAQQHEVVEILVLPDHAALHLVLDRGLARERRLEADHRLDAGRSLGRVAVAPAAVIELGASFAARLLAHLARAPPGWHSSDRRCPAPAAPRPPRGGGRRGRTGRRSRRPNRGRARSSPSRIASIAASVERSRSVSSIRSSILPPRPRA